MEMAISIRLDNGVYFWFQPFWFCVRLIIDLNLFSYQYFEGVDLLAIEGRQGDICSSRKA